MQIFRDVQLEDVLKSCDYYKLLFGTTKSVDKIIDEILYDYMSAIESDMFREVFESKLGSDPDFDMKVIVWIRARLVPRRVEYNFVRGETICRLARRFDKEFLREDFDVDWEKLLRFNSG